MPLSIRGVAVSLALLVSSTLLAAPAAPAAPAAYATIEGTGSTWAQTLVDQWIADVDAGGLTVVYTGGGSARGRRDFAQNSVDFAISEIPYSGTDESGQPDTSNGRDYSYVPIAAGGTAFTYQLRVGGELVRDLRLSGETLARIFTGTITRWSDAAITADNNGRRFPDTVITPVVRSDGSGATAQLTGWLDAEHPSIWRPFLGRSGTTAFYPRPAGVNLVGQAGSDQVMNAVAGFGGDGSIGYVENSYPADRGYPVVKVLNRGGFYVAPTEHNVAVALTRAEVNADEADPDYLTQVLDGVYANPDPRAYPISSYSYLIIPTGATDARMTTRKRQALADFVDHALCAGQSAAGAYGYAPLPLNLVRAGFSQVAKLKEADPGVDLTDRDVASCANPTFDSSDLGRDVLSESAPMPAACDRLGEGPCGVVVHPAPPVVSGPDGPAAVRLRVVFAAPRLVSGVYVVNPRRRYSLVVRTTSSQRPRYLHEVARGLPFRGEGTAMRPAGRAGGKRLWSLRVQVKPGAGTKKIGVRIGRTTRVLLVRRA